MIEKPVQTNAGPFDRARLKALREAIKDEDRDTVIKFEGQDLLVSFGEYLAQYVEMQLGSRNHGGL